MFGGLNLKTSSSSSNANSTSNGTISGFSFMTSSNSENHTATRHEESSPSNNRNDPKLNLNSSTTSTTKTVVAEQSSGFSFLNSAISSSSAPDMIIDNKSVNDSVTEMIVSENSSSNNGNSSSGLFDQLNFVANSHIVDKAVVEDSASSPAPVSTPEPIVEAKPVVSIKLKSSASNSGVARKKKRSVKIGAGLAQSSSSDGMDQNVSDTDTHRTTNDTPLVEPVITPDEALDQSAASRHVDTNDTTIERKSGIADQEDEVLQRAQAAAKLAMLMEKEESRDTGSFFKNAFWGASSKTKRSISASSHSHQQQDRLEPSPKSTFKPTAQSKIENQIEAASSITDHKMKMSGATKEDGDFAKSNVNDIQPSYSLGIDYQSKVPDQNINSNQEDVVPPISSYNETRHIDVTPLNESSASNVKNSDSIEPPSPVSSKDSLSTKSEKLRKLQSYVLHTVSNATMTLHSNLGSLRDSQARLSKSTNDERLLKSQIISLQAQIEDLVQREEYETAEVMNEEMALIEERMSEIVDSCAADKDQIETCRVWHKEHVHNIQSLFLDYKKKLNEMSNPEKMTDGTTKELSVSQLREEKERIDTNLSEIEVDEAELKKERADLEGLVAEETKVFVSDNIELKGTLDTVMIEISDLEKALAAKRDEANQLNERMKLNDEKIESERGKHEFRFKKLSNLEESLQTTKSEYEQIVVRINEQLKDAEDFQENVDREESTLSDALANVLPIALDFSSSNLFPNEDSESSEYSKWISAQQDVLQISSTFASAEMELQSAISAQKGIKSKLSAIESSLPQLESEKVQAAADRNFKAAASLNRQIKDMKIELDALQKDQTTQQEHLNSLKSAVEEHKVNLSVATDNMKLMESELLRSKLLGVKEQLLFCRRNITALKEKNCDLLISFVSANELYWDTIGMELASKCSIKWDAFVDGENNVTHVSEDVQSEGDKDDICVDPDWASSIQEFINADDRESLSTLQISTESQIASLEKRLSAAVEVEDYEEAAEIDEELEGFRNKSKYIMNIMEKIQLSVTSETEKGKNPDLVSSDNAIEEDLSSDLVLNNEETSVKSNVSNSNENLNESSDSDIAGSDTVDGKEDNGIIYVEDSKDMPKDEYASELYNQEAITPCVQEGKGEEASSDENNGDDVEKETLQSGEDE